MSALALVPRSPEWHADRRGGIGSSDAPIITGDAPRSWGEPIELLQRLYAEKTGLIDAEDRPDNSLMEWGRRLEDVVAAWYTESTGRKVQRVNRRDRHPKHEWMTASLDRLTSGTRPRRVVEIKTSAHGGEQWGEPGSAEIPIHVLVQVMHQLAVTGLPVADVAVLMWGSDPRIYTVERDEEMIASLIELEGEFMACVREGRTPDFAGLTDRGARVKPPAVDEIAADEHLDRLIASTHAAVETRKAAEMAEAGLKAKLAELAEPYGLIRGTDVDLTYRPNKPSTKTTWQLVAQAYRKTLEIVDRRFGEQVLIDVDLDAAESTFTVELAGARPMRFTARKEGKE